MAMVLAIAVAVAVFVLWIRRQGPIGGAPRRRKPACDWAQVDPEETRTLREFRCATCGETGYGRAGHPPATCKRGLGKT